MAWRGMVTQPVGATAAGMLSVVVQYYDDADPTNTGVGVVGPGNGTAAASTDLVSITNHGLTAGNQVVFTALTGGAGLAVGVQYTVLSAGLTANVFAVSTSATSSTAVNITTNYTAVTAYKVVPPVTVTWSQAWDLPIGVTTQQFQDAVVQEGAKARAWIAARDSARASVPTGTSYSIP